MLKYDAAAGPRALTSSARPCCHACWMARVMRRQSGCFSAREKRTPRPRSESRSLDNHAGRPLTASTFLGSNVRLMSSSRKCASSFLARPRQPSSAAAAAAASAAATAEAETPAGGGVAAFASPKTREAVNPPVGVSSSSP